MACSSVTVIAAKPVISQLVATVSTTIIGNVDLSWNQDISGSITIKVDNVPINTGGYPAGTNTNTVSGLSLGNHLICVDAT